MEKRRHSYGEVYLDTSSLRNKYVSTEEWMKSLDMVFRQEPYEDDGVKDRAKS